MKIDQLPIEVLMNIVSYLSRFDELSLVNKLFYSIVCKINDPYICLRLDDHLFKHGWLPSIEKSTREISKFDIYFGIPDVATCRAMISIITKFGAFIKCLRISQTRMALAEFLEILSLVPNVEHLVIERLDLREKEVPKRWKRSTDNDLDLHQLKKLCFRGNNIVERDEFLAVFKRLPVGVLTELSLSSFKFNAAFVLFRRQTNITKLKMTEFVSKVSDPVHILDDLQLQSLVISSYSSIDIAIFLSKQTQLKSLTIPNDDATEECLNFVANHKTELETLSINISTAPSASCKANISKMKSLQHLSVRVNEDTATNQLESLTEYPYFGITSLSLHDTFLNHNLVQALAKSLTKLKDLKLYVYDNSAIVNTVMSNFNFVEVLHIRGNIGYHGFGDGDYFNPKLTELIAPLPKNVPRMYLTKLIAAYPNLKKFQINWDLITSSQFRQVLNGFTKLESLTFIGGAERLTMNDLNYLTDHKYNLKFVSLGGLQIRFTDELKRHLSATFGVIICDGYSVRIMAVDRHRMNRERNTKEKGLVCGAFS